MRPRPTLRALCRSAARLAALALPLVLPAPGASAQSFLGSGPAERLTLPPSGGALRPPPASEPVAEGPGDRTRAAPPGARAPEAAPRPQVQATIAPARRLPAGPRGFRLLGEDDTLRYPVYLTEAQLRGPVRIRLSYLSAISIAPESSELSVAINGTKVGWTRIQAPGAVKVVEFAVPEGLLKAGYNAVAFQANQRHRVDCSVGATYELWTQIDPSRSGLVVGPAVDMDVRSLAALEPDESGALPIGVVLNQKPTPARLERMIAAVQALAVTGRVARPAVTFGSPLTGRGGVNLIVGNAAEIRGIEGVAELGAISGPRLAVLAPKADRPPSLVVTGPGDAEVGEAIAQLAAGTEPTGTPAGIAFVNQFRGYRIGGGESLALDRLGVATREFDGRLMRVGFELRFPGDFVPADYGKVMLHLAGAYAAGLEPGSQIVVDINGRNAASVPLPNARGEVFDDSAVPLPLGLWRPGVNRVEVFAQVPTGSDRTCDTLASGAKRARFLFLDRSRIDIPAIARAARSPDLAAIKGGAVPFTAPGARPRLVLPAPDRDTTDAAATLVARLAMAAERVIDFEVVPQPRGAEAGGELVVAPARALDPTMLTAAGLDPDQIRQAWESRAETVAVPGQFGPGGVLTLDRLRRNLPMRCALPVLAAPPRPAPAPAPQAEAAPARTEPATEQDIVARWDASVRGSWSIAAGASELWDGVVRSTKAVLGAAAVQLQEPEGRIELPPGASLLVAEGQAPRGGSTVLVSAPNPSILKASVSCLVDPVVWARLSGQAAFLNGSDGTLAIVQPERVEIVETQPRALANARIVTAAWMSLHTGYYVAMTLALAVCLGLATTSLVRNVGRRNG